jgi:acetoacetate decarboxylase
MNKMELRHGFDPLKLWSTPALAPLVPQFPIEYRRVSILTVVYRTHREAIRSHLPKQLEPTNDIAMIHLYDMPDVQGMGRVTECNIMVGARFPEGPGICGGFTTNLYINSDAGLAQGREIHGQPKKMASIKLRAHGDLLVGTVKRNGIRILRATTPYKYERANVDSIVEHFDFRTNLNLKVVRNIDGSPGICQITARRLVDVQVSECWRGPATVELVPNAQAPVHELPVIEAVEAYSWTADFNLVGGQIVKDLLPGRAR